MSEAATHPKAASAGTEFVSVPSWLIEFLYGAGQDPDGRWFGDRKEGEGAYWWRKHLRGITKPELKYDKERRTITAAPRPASTTGQVERLRETLDFVFKRDRFYTLQTPLMDGSRILESGPGRIVLYLGDMGFKAREALREIDALPIQQDAEDGWRDISTAPKDGTAFQAKIPGHGSDNVIAWTAGLLNARDEECGGWHFVEDQEPPDDWTDGICWNSNADERHSTPPTHWRPLPATPHPAAGER